MCRIAENSGQGLRKLVNKQRHAVDMNKPFGRPKLIKEQMSLQVHLVNLLIVIYLYIGS